MTCPRRTRPGQAVLLRVLVLSGLLLPSARLPGSQAQVPTAITPDGTLGTTVTRNGTVHTIAGGTRPWNGPNLFHSFDRFSVGTGDTAHFTGPAGIANILSRVTGGVRSDIDGRLQSTIPGANVYLLNPSGVVFGPNATLNVSGSFHVSTADFLRLADGATFSAHLSANSVLTVAPPAAFGFLGAQPPAQIQIQGSGLTSPPGQTLSVVGGDLLVARGQLRAPSGRVNLASVAAAGEVGLRPAPQTPALEVATVERLGRIDLVQGTRLDTSGTGGGGTVTIRGGHVRIDQQSLVFANTLGAVDGARTGVDVHVMEEMVVTEGSLITTDVLGAGKAGDIQIMAGSLAVRQGAIIGSRVLSDSTGAGGTVTIRATALAMDGGVIQAQSEVPEGGPAGDIMVETERLTLTAGAQISGTTFGAGPGGTVTVTAREGLHIAGQDADGFPSGVFSNTAGAGAAGAVRVEAGQLTMQEGGGIASSTFSTGAGGTVTIRAMALAMDGRSLIGAGSDPPEGGLGGPAGDIMVETERLTLTGVAQISSSTFGTGRGGTVTVTARERLHIAGQDAAGLRASGLLSSTEGAGAAGAVRVEAGQLTMQEGGVITSSTLSTGAGGTVTIRATALAMDGGLIRARSRAPEGGPAGGIMVETERLTLTGGAQISSSTLGAGAAGTVTVTATDAVAIAGQGSGFFTTTEGSGRGGDIALQARNIRLTNGAEISAASSGSVDAVAGNITITATNTLLMRDHSAITTEAARADGGNITLTVASLVRLRDSQITAAVGSGEGTGGNITIDPEFVVLENAQITANAFGGPGGNITITAGVFLADLSSQVSASSALGIAGTVDIRAPVTNVSGSLGPLPQAFAPVAELLRDRCTPQLREARASRFVLRGREGVPVGPERVLLSPLGLGGSGEGAEDAVSRGSQASEGVPQRVAGVPVDDECSRARGRGTPGQVRSTPLRHAAPR